MNRLIKTLTVVLASLALVAVGSLPVLAQQPASPPDQLAPDSGRLPGAQLRLWRLGRGCALLPEVAEEIAKALDMDLADLQARLQDGATLADLADEAHVDLQSLYDLAPEARQGGLLRAGRQGRGAFDLPLRLNDDAELAAAAKALGLTADELELQLWGGRSLADLAERAGVELADVQAAIQQARLDALRTRLQQAVDDERITQEQADWLLVGAENGWLDGAGLWALERPAPRLWGLGPQPAQP
ncbi:MAG: hypothetical protein ACOX3S_05600 [Anaerolineae bacterium]|jgi:hypothetical protein